MNSSAEDEKTLDFSLLDLLDLEKVIVTARKREEYQLEVPISISYVPGRSIADFNTLKLEELATNIPNFHLAEANQGNQLFIRGIGSGVNRGFEQTVGTYVDGVYYGMGVQSRFPVLDLERVEVLKGPQSVLFGKNTVAGAINITTANPTSESKAVLDLYAGEYGETTYTGIFSGPLSDKFRARLAMRGSMMDGWLDNEFTGKTEPDTKEQVVRLTAIWDVNPELEINTKLNFGQYEVIGRSKQIGICNQYLLERNDIMGVTDDCLLDNRTSRGGDFVTHPVDGTTGDFRNEDQDTSFKSVGITINAQLENGLFTSQTAYLSHDATDRIDTDETAAPLGVENTTEVFSQISQELRYTTQLSDTLEALFGFYWQDADISLDVLNNVSWNNYTIVFRPTPFTPNEGLGSTHGVFSRTSQSWALFSEFVYDIIPNTLDIAFGLRYGKESQTGDRYHSITDLGTTTTTTNADVINTFGIFGWTEVDLNSVKREESELIPSLTVSWFPSEDGLIYASAKTGHKGGGYDAELRSPALPFEFEDETVDAYELGLKFSFPDLKATLSAAIFHSVFQDVQVSTFDGTTNKIVGNAAETRSQGVEVDIQWQMNDNMTIALDMAYLDSEYTNYTTAACYYGQTEAEGCVGVVFNAGEDDEVTLNLYDLSGRETQFSPKLSATLGIRYGREISEGMILHSQINISHNSEYAIANDLDPNLYQGAFNRINMSVAISPFDEQWTVAMIVKNITDVTVVTWANDTPITRGSFYKHTDRPRTIALQAKYRY